MIRAFLASSFFHAGWAGASGGDGRGRAPQVVARPQIAVLSPVPAVHRAAPHALPEHGGSDAAVLSPSMAAAPLSIATGSR